MLHQFSIPTLVCFPQTLTLEITILSICQFDRGKLYMYFIIHFISLITSVVKHLYFSLVNCLVLYFAHLSIHVFTFLHHFVEVLM